MANGSFNIGTSNQYILGTLAFEGAGRISDNKTPVYFELRFSRTNSGFTTTGSGWFTVKVNGSPVSVNPSNFTLTQNSNTLVLNGTVEVEHDSNGGKYFVIEVSGNTNVFSVTTTSAGFWLDNIPRAATVSDATDFVSNQNPTIWYSNPGGFALDVAIEFGGTNIMRYNIPQGSAYTFVLTQAEKDLLFSKCPNSETLAVRFVICTKYDGVNQAAWDWEDRTMTVESGSPSIGSLVPTMINNAVPAAWGIYVQTKSQCKLDISSASGVFGSWIVGSSISGGGFSVNGPSLTTGLLPNSGVITFTATVTDSRGRTASTQVSITVVPYANPSVSNVHSQRCLNDGTPNDDGTYVKARATLNYSSCNGKNSFGTNVAYRKSGDTTWIDGGTITSDVAKVIGGGLISTDFSYEIKYYIGDWFTASDFTDIVSSGFFTIDYKRGGKGVAFGKVAEYDNLLDIAFQTKIRSDLEVTGKINGYTASGYMKYVGWVNSPGLDANSIAEGTMGFTYGNNAPYTGFLGFFGAGNYGLQLNSTYSGGASNQLLAFRTRNGDTSSWNDWKKIVTDDLLVPWTVAPAWNGWSSGVQYSKTRTGIVNILIAVDSQSGSLSDWIGIASLPVGIRPFVPVSATIVDAYNSRVYPIMIQTDGVIVVGPPLLGSGLSAHTAYYTTLSYYA